MSDHPSGDTLGRLDIASLRERYLSGELSPTTVIRTVYERISQRGDDHVWISLVDPAVALQRAEFIEAQPGPRPPLFGIPFAVKDNIDAAAMQTTAACPEFAYTADESAAVVDRLEAAGAILIGKTNLDQFATGLNGTRSPYGSPSTPFDDEYISGGSSSGSAVAVAAGLVSFALGTDTAGSGRVPAALTGIVGMKPSVGLVSILGVVPACRSIDCVTAFTLTVDDGALVLHTMAGVEQGDAWARPHPVPDAVVSRGSSSGLRLAVPETIDFDGSPGEQEAWESLCARLVAAGAQLVRTDMAPFLEAGLQLYDGAWVAERLDGLEEFIDAHPHGVHPVVRDVLAGGRTVRGVEVFESIDHMNSLRLTARDVLGGVDAMLTPTVTTTFRIAEMEADPVALNSRLGTYTTFTNLLDLCAVAVPAGLLERDDRTLPFGVTVQCLAGHDTVAAGIASTIEALFEDTGLDIAVVGAHLEGMPLHQDLLALGAQLVSRTRTAPVYRLYALAGTKPPKPGLRRVGEHGAAIEVEVYRLPIDQVGAFMAGIVSPLAIGRVVLEDGTMPHGFVCESFALDVGLDITEFGGWRNYVMQ